MLVAQDRCFIQVLGRYDEFTFMELVNEVRKYFEYKLELSSVHPEMVDFGFRQGPSEFSTADIANYFED